MMVTVSSGNVKTAYVTDTTDHITEAPQELI